MQPFYTSREVAEVVGVEEARLERWSRSGIVRPSEKRGRTRLYTFQDLIAAKAAKELTDRGVSDRAVKRNLAALAATLPAMERAISRLRVVSDGEQLVVLHEDVAFEPTSGQVVMDFVVGALSTRAAEVLSLPRSRSSEGARATDEESSTERTAWAIFREACALEAAGDEAGSETALRRAIERDPNLAAAHTNLGNLAFRAGRRGEAREHYDRALALDPDQPEARYNLGNLLDALGQTDRAITEWARVAALEPDFADAFFNLGVGLAKRGVTLGARAALERFLALDQSGGTSDGAVAARALCDELAARTAS